MTVYSQGRYAVVITEIMADPSPPAGLPNYEWLELKNISGIPIDMTGWRIADASSRSGPMPSFILGADSVVLICGASAAGVLSIFGHTIPVAVFPSLDNNGELLSLIAPDERVIHAVKYESAWYKNDLKGEGGWSLEMVDTKNSCAGGTNWKACVDPLGGSPGRSNSVDGTIDDNEPPQLERSFTAAANMVNLIFDEPLDSQTSASLINYTIDGGMALSAVILQPPLYDQVQLSLSNELAADRLYTIIVTGLKDCKGNIAIKPGETKAGLAAEASAGDIVINEILFNPRPNAFDYVELYNNSNKILDASKLHLANRNSTNTVSSIVPLSAAAFQVYPGEYLVMTQDRDNLALNYLIKEPRSILINVSLPSFPDDKGVVVLLNQQGEILDEVLYTDKFHFKLIDNPEGISLEKTDPNKNSNEPGNWHSAASTAGYGTPGYRNSHAVALSVASTSLSVEPKIFSPDNDGFDDLAMIRFNMDFPGYIANITLFDANGRPVKSLVRNETMAVSGYWTWDGLNDKGQRLPIGVYIVFTELFDLRGKKLQFKNTVVLTRKIN
jgi:hypothetical protein